MEPAEVAFLERRGFHLTEDNEWFVNKPYSLFTTEEKEAIYYLLSRGYGMFTWVKEKKVFPKHPKETTRDWISSHAAAS